MTFHTGDVKFARLRWVLVHDCEMKQEMYEKLWWEDRSETLLKIFWVVTRRRFLVYDKRFGITCLSHLQVKRMPGGKERVFI